MFHKTLVLARFVLLVLACSLIAPGSADARSSVRFAACGTCTSEGVEALILKQTNIADLVGLNLDVRFYTPPQMGAGIASNSLDVEWVGSQPTLAQLTAGIPIKIVAYQFDFELRLEASPGIKSAADLKNKKIGVPFGTTAYKLALDFASRHGIPLSSLVNVGAPDLGTALAGGQIAAAAIWDPVWGILEKNYKTVPLEKQFYTGFTNMRQGFLDGDRDAAVRFIAAQMLAVAFRANHQDEAAKRYETAFGVATDVARAAQEIDRSYGWKDLKQVDLSLNKKDRDVLLETKNFLLREKLIPKDIDPTASIDLSLLKDARALIKTSGISVAQIKYVSNAR